MGDPMGSQKQPASAGSAVSVAARHARRDLTRRAGPAEHRRAGTAAVSETAAGPA